MADAQEGRSPSSPTCARTFANYQGRRVHEKSQHPSSFHESEVAALKIECRKVRWDPEELAMMAEYEAKNQRAKNVNQLIMQHVLLHRTIEAIKGARCSESYKTQVHAAAAPSALPSASDPWGPTSPVTSLGSSHDTIPFNVSDSPNLRPSGRTAAGSPQPPPPHIRSEEEVHACM
ncbi:hypothetical protein E2C01_082236 [Portunus trituberculatus]|uniref:Uncharacterized protein n=1 Tax=Portunus trituberculatus TaxID=210409 RepID=A0A5B7IXY0_PORTR|nr:hypothetical protein [Portunus trituberculatus]